MSPNLKQLKLYFKELERAFRKNAFDSEVRCLKAPLLQLIEMIQLRIGPGKIIPEDYYRYKLYDDTQFNTREKKKFMSQEAIPSSICKTTWNILANDKFIFYSLLKGFGARLPNNFALYHRCRGGGGLTILRNAKDLKRYLLSDVVYPFVIKPVDGIYSQDVRVIQSLLPDEHLLILGDGTRVDIDVFIQGIDSFGHRGMLFQELLVPHPRIEKVCGPRVCTVRMIATVSPRGPELLYGLWKVAVGRNMADNYWRGNLIAQVDQNSGEVGRCVRGMGKDLSFHETHPDTGERLAGLMLPDWNDAKQECLHLASCFAGLPIQAWDVALTNKGPIFLEVNIVGSLFLPQLAHQMGFLDDRFENLLQSLSAGASL